jgi:hypothetical protein
LHSVPKTDIYLGRSLSAAGGTAIEVRLAVPASGELEESVYSRSLGWLTRTVLAAAVVLTAANAYAAKIDFEDLTGPNIFALLNPIGPQHLDNYVNVDGSGVDAVFDGGAILDETVVRDPVTNLDVILPANATSIYGAAFFGEAKGPSFPDVLTISFSQPVSNLLFDVINALGETVTYRVEDNAGHFEEFTLAEALLGGQQKVFFPLAGDTVTITPVTFNEFGHYDFFIDNIQFNEPVPEPATLVLLGSGLVSAAVARRRRRHTPTE